MRNIFLLSTIILVLTSSISYSQVDEKNDITGSIRNLNGTHSIYLNFGFKVNSSSSATASITGLKAETNIISILGYQYWFDNQWSIHVLIGVFSAEANVNYTNVSSISIVPILFGMSYYPEALSLGNAGRAHFGVNTGIYMGNGSKSGVELNNLSDIGVSSVSETVFGIESNAGIDFFISKWIKVGPEVSYHLISGFKEVIGNRKNYSGAVFSINIGLLL